MPGKGSGFIIRRIIEKADMLINCLERILRRTILLFFVWLSVAPAVAQEAASSAPVRPQRPPTVQELSLALSQMAQRQKALERTVYLAGLALVVFFALFMLLRRLRPPLLEGQELVLRDGSGA